MDILWNSYFLRQMISLSTIYMVLILNQVRMGLGVFMANIDS